MSPGRKFLYGGTLRPNVVPGQDFVTPGDITDRINGSTCASGCVADNVYYNKAAFSATALNAFGNAPRTLPTCCRRGATTSTSASTSRSALAAAPGASVRLEVLNIFNIVQWAAPASSAFGNSSFGQINTQANNMRMVQFTLRFAFLEAWSEAGTKSEV